MTTTPLWRLVRCLEETRHWEISRSHLSGQCFPSLSPPPPTTTTTHTHTHLPYAYTHMHHMHRSHTCTITRTQTHWHTHTHTYTHTRTHQSSDVKTSVSGLHTGGTTALGPALALCIGMASNFPSAEVILCTDGVSNVGVGNLEGSRSDPTFYTTVSSIGHKCMYILSGSQI